MLSGDTAFVVNNHQDTQEIITHFSKYAKALGLKINCKKTQVMNQPPSESNDIGQNKHTVNEFKYVSSTVAKNNRLDAELGSQMLSTSKTFGGLRKRVWFNNNLSIKIKYAVYSAIVFSTLQ